MRAICTASTPSWRTSRPSGSDIGCSPTPAPPWRSSASWASASLFWGERAPNGQSADHLRGVRSRLDEFQKRLGEIEDRRQAVVDEIDLAQESNEFLEDDLYEAQQKAEQKKLEWVIEREVAEFPVRPSIMPWSRGGEDDERLRKALLAGAAAQPAARRAVSVDPPAAARAMGARGGARAADAPDPGRAPAAAAPSGAGDEAPGEGAEARGAEVGDRRADPAGEAEGGDGVEGHPRLPREVLRARRESSGPARLGAQARISGLGRGRERHAAARPGGDPGAGLERRHQPRLAEPRGRSRRRRGGHRGRRDRTGDELDRRQSAGPTGP